MRSKLLLLLVAMGLILTLGMSVKRFNYENNTDMSSWQFLQTKAHSVFSSK